MKIDEMIFIDKLPKLDLHGFNRDMAKVAINDFVNDNIKMHNEIIVIVHGIGSGIIRKTTIDTLKINKRVLTFKSPYNNRGCMLVQLKIDNQTMNVYNNA